MSWIQLAIAAAVVLLAAWFVQRRLRLRAPPEPEPGVRMFRGMLEVQRGASGYRQILPIPPTLVGPGAECTIEILPQFADELTLCRLIAESTIAPDFSFEEISIGVDSVEEADQLLEGAHGGFEFDERPRVPPGARLFVRVRNLVERS